MMRIPRVESISAIKNHYRTVLASLSDGPILLTQNSVPVGVLVSPTAWNDLADRIEAMQNELAAVRASQN